jgi:dTDP-4-amino-4,6-dideoxygalactose transaminase
MAVLSLGANIRWADVLPDGTIDHNDVAKKMKDVRAILCTDWGGIPCHIKELQQFSVPIIEDACHAIGSEHYGNHVGYMSDFTIFSFQAIKHLTTADGGALVVKNRELVHKAKLMRWFGLDRDKGASMRCDQDPPIWGYKMQLNDIAASIGMANLNSLHDRLLLTRKHAERYNEAFGIEPDVHRASGYWLYTIMVNDQNCFIQYMTDNGVECSKVHDRNDTKSVFKQYQAFLPGVEDFDSHHICIPVGWWLSDEDVEYIIKLVLAYK